MSIHPLKAKKIRQPALDNLVTKPKDLDKIGLFVLKKGRWDGMRIIKESWFEESVKPAYDLLPECRMLWELIWEDFPVRGGRKADQQDEGDKAFNQT